eukprot:scaffold618_cov130-Cylindrotheca_fusiformis.AAC.32
MSDISHVRFQSRMKRQKVAQPRSFSSAAIKRFGDNDQPLVSHLAISSTCIDKSAKTSSMGLHSSNKGEKPSGCFFEQRHQ